MPHIAIIYHSVTGTTALMARAVAQGCSGIATTTSLLPIVGKDIHEGRYVNSDAFAILNSADAIVFGAPTFMGGPSAQFKAFADATSDRWDSQRWQGKLAAGFTTGTSLNGDQTSTLQYFVVLASQHGMVWLGLNIPGGHEGLNRLGVQLGASAQTAGLDVPIADLATANRLGSRVAQYAVRLSPHRKAC